VGILTDVTGAAASGNKTSVQGVDAGAVIAKQDGWTLKTYVGDTATSPATALTAAKTLVEQDHVDVILTVSALAFGAAPYLTQQGVPVVGAPEDGPEWIPSKNMFPVYGYLDTTKVSTVAGDFFKMEGVNNVGALGYSISPSSAEAAKAAAVSAQTAGLKVGYLNANFPFGSTNVQPVALAMKSAGVDGFTATVDPNTGFALVTALRQVGDPLKVALLPTGYGGDLLQAGPGALQSGQGVYFYTSFEPMEMNTAATQQLKSALTAIGINGDPTYAEYSGYASVALLLDALKTTGPNPTHAELITALNNVKGYNAAGLFGSHSFDLGDRTATAVGVDACIYVTKLSGSTFQLVPGADPICGTEIPGKSVSASS
jgi:ABC-type branched-subunit amino acid transport system substrate-binding protein